MSKSRKMLEGGGTITLQTPSGRKYDAFAILSLVDAAEDMLAALEIIKRIFDSKEWREWDGAKVLMHSHCKTLPDIGAIIAKAKGEADE